MASPDTSRRPIAAGGSRTLLRDRCYSLADPCRCGRRPKFHLLVRARGQCALSRVAAIRPPRSASFLIDRSGKGREEAEIDVHRLKRARAGVDQLDMAAGYMIDERADRRGGRRRRQRAAQNFCRSQPPNDDADGGAFDISLAPGDLSGEAQLRPRLQTQTLVEQARRIEIGVAMQAAEPGELRALQARESCGRCAPVRRISALSESRPC